MINPNIHVQKCEQLDAAIVEVAALKQQLQSAREELQRVTRSRDEANGLLDRANRIIAAFPGSNTWLCPDCGCFAENGKICSGCGLNHPKQSANYKESV